MAVWNTINRTNIRPDRCDAEYFQPLYSSNIKMLSKNENKKLGDIFTIVNRGEKADYQILGTIPVLRSVNVRDLGFNDQRQEFVTKEYFNKKRRGQVKKEDILITSTGTGTLGRTSIWYKEEEAFNVPENSFLRGPKNVNPYCVSVFLSTKFGKLQLFQNQRGSSGQLHLYPIDIRRVIIPAYIFDYQDEIGGYLTQSFKCEEQSKSLYRQAEELLSKELHLDELNLESKKCYTTNFSEVVLSQRIDANHYRDDYSNLFDFLKANFSCKSIGQIVSINRRGLQPVYVSDGRIMVVNSKHLSETHINYDQTERTSIIEHQNKVVAQIFYGDVLIYTTGAYIGLTNAFNSHEPALASNHVNILRISDNSIDPNYLALIMNSKVGKLQVQKHSRGSAQLELYPADIAKFIIPIIDENKMRRIGKMVSDSLSTKQQSKGLLARAKQRVEELIEQEANKTT